MEEAVHLFKKHGCLMDGFVKKHGSIWKHKLKMLILKKKNKGTKEQKI